MQVVLIFKTTRNLEHTVSPVEQIMKNDAEISEHPVENDVETNVDDKLGLSCAKLRASLIFSGLD